MSTSTIEPNARPSRRRVTFARSPQRPAENAEDSGCAARPGAVPPRPDAATRNLRCKRLEISRRDGEVVKLEIQDVVDIRALGTDEVLPDTNVDDVIYLLEITDELDELVRTQLSRSGLEVPKQVFDAHLGRDVSGSCFVNEAFFMYWPVPVQQDLKYWEIEQRLRYEGTESLSTDLDHNLIWTGYERWPKGLPRRPYYPLLPAVTGSRILHYAMTAASFYSHTRDNSGRSVHGCVLVDPRRQYTIKRFNYESPVSVSSLEVVELPPSSQFCFLEEQANLERICDMIESRRGYFSRQNTSTAVIQCITSLILDDMFGVMFQVSRGLDYIELSLYMDDLPASVVSTWRKYLGHWRNSLVYFRTSASTLLEVFEHSLGYDKQHARGFHGQQASEMDLRTLSNLRRLSKDVEATRARVETVFQALMSTLSIMESQRAIAQAKEVSKLTNLAFFFIPLSFVATVFGTNVVEFQEHFTWRLWVGVSIGTTAITYFVLYFAEISNAWRNITDFILRWLVPPPIFTLMFLRKMKFRNPAGPLVTLSRLPALAVFVVDAAVLAGLSVVAMRFPLSTGAAVAVSFAMAIGATAFCLGPAIRFYSWRLLKYPPYSRPSRMPTDKQAGGRRPWLSHSEILRRLARLPYGGVDDSAELHARRAADPAVRLPQPQPKLINPAPGRPTDSVAKVGSHGKLEALKTKLPTV
ncbi:uncharacterized protein B0T15DRAFT_535726 [Chaetomium strumarium]|uniref:Uncharacterized protein n=1 Tax=Chaetomium strumarium TaxID=1170767 RepID=A0AAJ0GQB6_9PEZI|nr:hypothetical protein B0T15DRAFT_535726 [Chaetomium strumarium]